MSLKKVFRINRNTIIYVLCPAHIVTGGIEAVHQLVDKLRRLGHKAFIVPSPVVKNPRLLQYKDYDVEFTSSVTDSKFNILITTEVNPRALDQYTHIQKALWWLSVDNHENLFEKFEFTNPINQDIIHLAQSSYAHSFLKNKGVKTIYYLSDYLHKIYLRNVPCRKKDLVLYTPLKGANTYIDQLMTADPSIHWLPLRGLGRRQHALMMRQAKVYVDFGSHPGKDRQPREAVVNGCCVLVGLRGSATHSRDIPIPDSYKFILKPYDSAKILFAIQNCLRNYDSSIKEFHTYSINVRNEESVFENEVFNIFGMVALSSKSASRIILHNTIRFVRENDWLTVTRGMANEFLPLAAINRMRWAYRSVSGQLNR